MSNFDKAVEVARRVEHDVLTAASYGGPPAPHEYVMGLNEAGLISPDAPAPGISANGTPSWSGDGVPHVTHYVDTEEVGVMIDHECEFRFTPEQAIRLAGMLIASARHQKAE